MRIFKQTFLKAAVGGFIALLALLSSSPTYAQEATDSIKTGLETPERESLFPSGTRNLAYSHFSWGAEIGTSIDLSGYDMSTINADAYIGYKNRFIRFVGVGAGIHRAFGTGYNFIPVYALFRSSFRTRPSLFFFHFQAGYSFNTIGDAPIFGDVSGSIGAGVNLAMSTRFQSHLLLAFGFRHFNRRHQETTHLDTENVGLAQIAFGVNF